MSATVDLASLFGTQQVIVVQHEDRRLHFTTAHHLRHWRRAYDQWLAELPAANTRRAYQRAWDDLLTFTHKQPWTLHGDDVRDWIQDLDRRPLHTAVAKGLQRKGRRQNRVGYSPSTIKQYLAGVSSFYTFACERYTITDPHGRPRPLHPGPNPARTVRRPSPNPFGKADYLQPEAITAILAVIPTHTVQGLRDMALILGYVLTGRRNSEWRCLRWGDIEQRGTKAYHVWSGKGKQAERHELAPPVWDAIRAYLTAAGRLKTIQPSEYIFVPLNDRATRFHNVRDDAWHRDRPLSRSQANRLLKKYARRASLDATQVTIHTLRHSFAMLLDDLGVDVKTISKRLAHSNLNVTMIYLDHLKGVPDQTWRQAAAALNLDLLNQPAPSKARQTRPN